MSLASLCRGFYLCWIASDVFGVAAVALSWCLACDAFGAVIDGRRWFLSSLCRGDVFWLGGATDHLDDSS